MTRPSARRKSRAWMIPMTLLASAASLGHINSPHVFIEEQVGPYAAVILVHMPRAIPGEAEMQVRLQDQLVGERVEVLAREIPPQGVERAPDWIPAVPSPVDPAFYSAPLPLMVHGLWRIEIRIQGSRGEGSTLVPLPARVARPRRMALALSVGLLVLTAILTVSLVQILAGLARDAHRGREDPADRRDHRRARGFAIAGVVTFAVFVGFIAKAWWDFDAHTRFMAAIALTCEPTVENPPAVAGKPLSVRLQVNGRNGQPLARVVPDHGKMMHLIVIDRPDARSFLHVHPRMTEAGSFVFQFTPPASGTYQMFGDLLLDSGEGDTVTASLDVGAGREVRDVDLEDDDDASSFQPPLEAAEIGNDSWQVGDGLVLRWTGAEVPTLRKGEFTRLEFELADADGNRVEGLEPYIGMAGHLLIVRDDLEVFAHVHPAGTVGGRGASAPPTTDPSARLPPEVSFPYAFPDAGRYRLWVQVRHLGRVRTGVFDVLVDQSI